MPHDIKGVELAAGDKVRDMDHGDDGVVIRVEDDCYCAVQCGNKQIVASTSRFMKLV